jgi:hypothetical protein
VRDHRDELGAEVEIVVVAFTGIGNVDRYIEVNDVAFRLLIDPERRGYQAYGLGRGSRRRVYGWRSARRYFQIYRDRGLADIHHATEDTLQLGGDFVVDPQGILTYGFWGTGPDDRPAVSELVAAVGQ